MATYLVFAIVYCNVFDGLPIKASVNTHNEPVQFWHLVLCRHKAPFNFYIVQDRFVREFRHMLVGAEPKRITQKVEEFLKGKGICIQEENHTYIWLYGCQENPLLLPIFFCDRYFVMEVFGNIKPGVFYLTGREKINSLHFLFELETQLSRIGTSERSLRNT
jgi:hypothetical protein